MNIKRILLWPVLLACALLIFSACSSQEEEKKVTEKKVEKQPVLTAEQVAKLTEQIHLDLDSITKAATLYQQEKGKDPANSRVLKGYLEAWPTPPDDIRDRNFKMEWSYFITGTLDDMGGPTEQPDTVVFLEGVTEQVCFDFNQKFVGQGAKAWDFVGKKERPDAESWCENGGNPYRIIHVVSLR